MFFCGNSNNNNQTSRRRQHRDRGGKGGRQRADIKTTPTGQRIVVPTKSTVVDHRGATLYSNLMLLQANLSLRGCLAMCLIFQENPGSRAYKLVAYKKEMCISIAERLCWEFRGSGTLFWKYCLSVEHFATLYCSTPELLNLAISDENYVIRPLPRRSYCSAWQFLSQIASCDCVLSTYVALYDNFWYQFLDPTLGLFCLGTCVAMLMIYATSVIWQPLFCPYMLLHLAISIENFIMRPLRLRWSIWQLHAAFSHMNATWWSKGSVGRPDGW